MNIASITNPSAVASQTSMLSHVDHARATKLKGAALRTASEAEQRAAVGSQFEAIMVRQLLGKTMTSMMGGSKDSTAGSVYGDLITDTLAQSLTSGQGLGLGRMLEQQLAPRAHAAANDPSSVTSTQAHS